MSNRAFISCSYQDLPALELQDEDSEKQVYYQIR